MGMIWFKHMVDMHSNHKIRAIRQLKRGNDYVLIFVMLLEIAGRCAEGGRLFVTEGVEYTVKSLAFELEYDERTVISALEELEKFGLVDTSEGLRIKTWDKYQSLDASERRAEKARQRMAAYRGRLKEAAADQADDMPDIGAEQPAESDVPTLGEVERYCAERGSGVDARAFYDYYSSIGWMMGRNPIKDWRAAVRRWERSSQPSYEPPRESARPSSNPALNYDQREYDDSEFKSSNYLKDAYEFIKQNGIQLSEEDEKAYREAAT